MTKRLKSGDGLYEGTTSSASGDGLYESTTSSATVSFRLPPCPPEIYCLMGRPRHLDKIKLRLLKELELTCYMEEFDKDTMLEFTIPAYLSQEEAIWYLNRLVHVARIVCMDQIELYFVEDGDKGPFSPINELQSLNLILKGLREALSDDIIHMTTPDIQEDVVSGENDGKAALPLLEHLVIQEIRKYAVKHANTYSDPRQYLGGDDLLVTMAESMSIKTKLTVADVLEGGKGLVAREDINIGDIILEIPKSLVISEEGLDREMVEKYCNKGYANSWDILPLKIMTEGWCSELFPTEIKTGLSFSGDVLAAAEGTLLEERADSAQDWVRQVFQGFLKVDSVLSKARYKSYEQAYELLLSCGVDAFSQDGTRMSFLAPFAGFFKRSLFPHVLRCDHETNSLRFIAARPCDKGQQCYLSYGYLAGFEIAMNYGCLPKGKNHNDCILLDHDFVDGGPVMPDDSPWSYWMVRGDMKNEGNICLPKVLLDHLRSLVRETRCHIKDPAEIEEEGIRILLWCLEKRLSMLDFYETRANYKKALEKPTRDVNLALEYRKIERDACMSAISACHSTFNKISTR